MRWVVAVALCGGCELAFPLRDPPAEVDAAPLVDGGPPAKDAQVDAPIEPACGSGYTAMPPLPNHYRVVLDPVLNWVDAETACEADGAHLAVPATATDMGVYLTLVGGARTWVGVARDALDGNAQFRSITNVAFPEGNALWHAGEPNGTGPWVEVSNDGDNRLNDSSVVLVNRYICECDGLPITPFDF